MLFSKSMVNTTDLSLSEWETKHLQQPVSLSVCISQMPLVNVCKKEPFLSDLIQSGMEHNEKTRLRVLSRNERLR